MSPSKPGFAAIRKLAERGPEHSKLYEYLVQHFRRFSRATQNQKRVPWVDLAKLFSAEIGEPVTEVMARHTWSRVRQAAVRKKAAKAKIAAAHVPAVRSLMPSASPRDRVPIEYPRPQPLPPKPAEPSGPASPTDRTPAEARADAHIARMKRHFAERDGRKPTT